MKNIPENTSTETLKEIFQRHGEVIKVVMPPGKGGQGKRDFGFVHYAERSSALKAVRDSEKYEIDGMFYTLHTFVRAHCYWFKFCSNVIIHIACIHG